MSSGGQTNEQKNHSRIRVDPICNGMRSPCVCVFMLFLASSLCAPLAISHPSRAGAATQSIYRALQFILVLFFPRSTFSCLIRVDAHVVAQYLVFTLLSGPANKLKQFELCAVSIFAHECDVRRRVCRSDSECPRKRTHLPYLLLCMNLSFPAIMQNMWRDFFSWRSFRNAVEIGARESDYTHTFTCGQNRIMMIVEICDCEFFRMLSAFSSSI